LGDSDSYFQGSSNLHLTANDTLDLTGTTSLGFAFYGASSLSSAGNLNSWNVSQVTNMGAMFYNASSFNQPLDSWNVSQVTGMVYMFYYASSFNQPLDSWDVSQVTGMYGMFWSASSFNQPLDSWNVSQVYNTYGLFFDAGSFNQPLNSWDVSQVTDMNGMLHQITLSIANYDGILSGWSALNLQHGVSFDAGHSQYSKTVGEPAKMHMIDAFGWVIYDGGVYPPPTTSTTSTSTTPTTTSPTSTTPTTTTPTSTTNPTPFSWVTLIALPILGVMIQYKRETRKN